MNWKKIAAYLWPLLAWPSCVVTFFLALSLYHGDISPLKTVLSSVKFLIVEGFLSNYAWPYYTAPCLVLFALSCYVWLREQSRETFAFTVFTSWGLFGPLGFYVATWVVRPMYDAWMYDDLLARCDPPPTRIIYPSDLPMSDRILIMALIIAFPYILMLLRHVFLPLNRRFLPKRQTEGF